MKVLITGSAGFIGFHLANVLLAEGFIVHGYDGLTDYYDPVLKNNRHKILMTNPNFTATIGMLEDVIGKKAIRNYMPMQKRDVRSTWVDTSLLQNLTGYHPKTNVRDGIKNFVNWYRKYYNN